MDQPLKCAFLANPHQHRNILSQPIVFSTAPLNSTTVLMDIVYHATPLAKPVLTIPKMVALLVHPIFFSGTTPATQHARQPLTLIPSPTSVKPAALYAVIVLDLRPINALIAL